MLKLPINAPQILPAALPPRCCGNHAARSRLLPAYCFGKVATSVDASDRLLADGLHKAARCSDIVAMHQEHSAAQLQQQQQPLSPPQSQQQFIAEAAAALGQSEAIGQAVSAAAIASIPEPLKTLVKVSDAHPTASVLSASVKESQCGSSPAASLSSGSDSHRDSSSSSSSVSSDVVNRNRAAGTLKPSTVDDISNWAESYQMPDEMSLWDDDGSHFSSQRHLQLAYLPPKSDLPGFAAAVGLIAAWACVFRHAVFEYDMSAPLTLGHVLDGVLSFASLEFLSTGLFITTHDSMHGAVTPNNRFLNDVLGAVCVSLYAWFDYSLMWTKHWEHHNLCGTPKEDPDFHQGDPALLPWFFSFMKGYISWQQFVKLQATVLFFMWRGAALPNMLLFWMASGLVSAVRLFYFGTYVPHKPRKGGNEVMAWAKARSARAPALLSFLRCYHFDMHWEHHRWPFAPWWDLPAARSVRYNAIGSIDD